MVALIPLACSVSLVKQDKGGVSSNTCASDSDCSGGVCSAGTCVAYQGLLSTLLLEITPPTTAPGVGGVPFLQVSENVVHSNEDFEIDLPATGVSTVHGFVSGSKGCAGAGSTLPATVTLTPQEQAYGLPTVSYVATTLLGSVSTACIGQFPLTVAAVQEFSVSVPTGVYDVYVRPVSTGVADAGADDHCEFVPELFLSRSVPVGDSCLSLPSNPPKELDVDIPWNASATSLDGWTLSVVHPVTGQLLSGLQALHGAPAPIPSGGIGYTAVVPYSPIGTDDTVKPGQELLRLSPKEGVLGPSFQLAISGLEALSPKRAIMPDLGVLRPPVTLAAVVYGAAGFATGDDVPVVGTATFTATSLDGIADGVFAAFTSSATIASDGTLAAELLPGDYRVRIVPQAGSAFASTETSLTVACQPGAPDSCGAVSGRTILVPSSASITGSVTAPVGGKALDVASVKAVPASSGTRRCESGIDASACAAEPLGVLDLALGDDAFVPQPASGIVDAGRFDLTGVDCGGCTPDDGALFDVSIRPPDGSDLPWLVKPDITVSGPVSLGRLQMPLPIIERGIVEIPVGHQSPVPVPGALIQAFVVRDADGVPILQPQGLPSCAAAGSPVVSGKPAPCIRSVLQIAETRTGPDAKFDLVLPSTLGTTP